MHISPLSDLIINVLFNCLKWECATLLIEGTRSLGEGDGLDDEIALYLFEVHMQEEDKDMKSF